jgi:hypothetical protein
MLTQQTVEKLHTLRLRGMAEAFREQEQDPEIHRLSFEERLGLLVDRQWNWKHHQALERRKCRDRLVGIELKSWQEETLLQPADLIAYENFKVAERKHAGAEMRLTMKKILDTEFRGRNAWLQKDPLQKWRDKANKETLNRLFVPARMKPLS